MRDGTYPASCLGSGPIIRDPADNLNQVYLKDVLRNPHNWSDPALDKLIAAQDVEPDPVKRKAMFLEIVDILQQGEGHAIPIAWRHWGGMLDYRIRNWCALQTIQLVHKWDHLWFDPDRKMPSKPGYQP